jgi:hypothetical protein
MTPEQIAAMFPLEIIEGAIRLKTQEDDKDGRF